MRMNLDPLEQYKDEAVWSALEQVTHTYPLFDKRYCPVNSSSRPVRAGNVKSSAWWTVLRKIWQARPVQRPIETLFFAQWPPGQERFQFKRIFQSGQWPLWRSHPPHNIQRNWKTKDSQCHLQPIALYNLFRLIWKPRSPASLAVCTSRWNIVILSLLSFNSYTIFLGQ